MGQKAIPRTRSGPVQGRTRPGRQPMQGAADVPADVLGQGGGGRAPLRGRRSSGIVGPVTPR